MEQNCTDAMDDRRRYEESVRELSRLIRTPRLGIDCRRLYNRNAVEPSGPTLRATLLVGREKWQTEVLLTETGAACRAAKEWLPRLKYEESVGAVSPVFPGQGFVFG